MPSIELAEWMAFDQINGQVAELVKDGVDPRTAAEVVWKDRSEE